MFWDRLPAGAGNWSAAAASEAASLGFLAADAGASAADVLDFGGMALFNVWYIYDLKTPRLLHRRRCLPHELLPSLHGSQ